MDWLRWYQGTVTDPKWRCVSSDAGATGAEVLAVWACMMEHANKADPRGTLRGWNDRVIGMLLDVPPERVGAIRVAMQELVLEGEALAAWEKRQPTSTERVRKHRERKRAETDETPETPETPRGDKRRGEEKPQPSINPSERAGALALDEEQHISLVIRLANRGMSDNPGIDRERFRPILPSHGPSRQAVADWRARGIDWPTIEATVYDRAMKYPPSERYSQIGTLAYFHKAVVEAHERAAAMDVLPPDIAPAETGDWLRSIPADLREWAERLDVKLREDELGQVEAEKVRANLRKLNEQDRSFQRMRPAEQQAFIHVRLLNWYGERIGEPKPRAA